MAVKVSRIALPLCMLASGLAAGRLVAQTALVRATVSDTLPHYIPGVAIRGALEIPMTDSLSDVGEEWNHGYKKLQPRASLVFLPKLTAEAVKALQDGTSSLVLTAREMTADEVKAFQAKYGYPPMRIPVVMDAIIVFVNRANPIAAVSMAQLDAIYSRDRKGGAPAPAQVWGDLGVKGELANRPINAYSRAEGTATRTAFGSLVLLGGPYRPGVIDRQDNESMAEAVTTDAAGIAFGSMTSWFATNKTLPVAPYQSSEARYPTQDMVSTSQYPMQRLFFAYLNRAPGKPVEPAAGEALRYILSQEGQNVVADVGLFPAPAEFVLNALKHLSD